MKALHDSLLGQNSIHVNFCLIQGRGPLLLQGRWASSDGQVSPVAMLWDVLGTNCFFKLFKLANLLFQDSFMHQLFVWQTYQAVTSCHIRLL